MKNVSMYRINGLQDLFLMCIVKEELKIQISKRQQSPRHYYPPQTGCQLFQLCVCPFAIAYHLKA